MPTSVERALPRQRDREHAERRAHEPDDEPRGLGVGERRADARPTASSIARTTKTPPATAITMPIAVEIFARCARFRRSPPTLGPDRPVEATARARPDRTCPTPSLPWSPSSPPPALPRRTSPEPGSSPVRRARTEMERSAEAWPQPCEERRCEDAPEEGRGCRGRRGPDEDRPVRLNLVVVRGDCSGPAGAAGARVGPTSRRAVGAGARAGRSHDLGAGDGLGAGGAGSRTWTTASDVIVVGAVRRRFFRTAAGGAGDPGGRRGRVHRSRRADAAQLDAALRRTRRPSTVLLA